MSWLKRIGKRDPGTAAIRLERTDDSGFMGVVDPDAYVSFVKQDWEIGDLTDAFRGEISRGRLLFWGTGRGDIWNVDVRVGGSGRAAGFRAFESFISSSKGRLLLTSYEELTMAAGRRSVTLPEPHSADMVFSVEPGQYRCRVVQTQDPEPYDIDREEIDFVIELTKIPGGPVSGAVPFPWSELG